MCYTGGIFSFSGRYMRIKEYRDQRVVTFRDIDTIHDRVSGLAQRIFNENKRFFIKGVDYFVVDNSEVKISDRFHGQVILITESGYTTLIQTFIGGMNICVWIEQCEIVNKYFKGIDI